VRVLGKWASPFSNRVDLALKLKGVSYKYSEEDLRNKSQDLLRYNPVHKKVPILIHNGNPLAESLVIVEYIDQTWTNNPLLPQDPYERALAHFWAKTLDDKVCLTLFLFHFYNKLLLSCKIFHFFFFFFFFFYFFFYFLFYFLFFLNVHLSTQQHAKCQSQCFMYRT